tara:strand:- start:196276 stop:196755 length:480 start_codon:yes stop_codon:yes gene_type:complete
MLKPLALAIAAASMAFTASATPGNPEAVAEMLRNSDSANVEIEWVDDTIARIDANRDGYNYSIRMMDCNADQYCVSNMIFATFDMDGSPALADYIKINEYNDSYPFGRAFLIGAPDEDGYVIGIDYTFMTSDENVLGEEEVNLFFVVLDSFVKHMQEEG